MLPNITISGNGNVIKKKTENIVIYKDHALQNILNVKITVVTNNK
jgi:hypothetical protein